MNFIEKYEEYLKSIEESLDTSDIEVKWIENTNRIIGLFTVNDNTYQLDFKLFGNVWSYKFYIANKVDDIIDLSPKATGFNKDVFKVLAVSKNGLIHMIENNSPDCIIFSATNDDSRITNINGEELSKRQHIYLMLLEQIPKIFPDYDYIVKNISNYQIYIIKKKNLKGEETFENIKKVISEFIV
jgi:hypothetical protein